MIRSLFFVPANRRELIAKLPRIDADCSVLDLEDGIPPNDKERARAELPDAVASLRAQGLKGRLVVRVNEPASQQFLPDLDAVFASGADGVVIPKTETCEQLAQALQRMDRGGPVGRPTSVIAGIETMHGVLNAARLCAMDKRVDTVYFGAEDFIADIGGVRTERGDEVLYARSQVVLAARAAGATAIDQAVADVRNDALFLEDARHGRALGYNGKICVLPRQLALCHEAFSPSARDIDHARRMLAAYAEAASRNIGTIEFEGKLIDGPMLKRAQGVVADAARFGLWETA